MVNVLMTIFCKLFKEVINPCLCLLASCRRKKFASKCCCWLIDRVLHLKRLSSLSSLLLYNTRLFKYDRDKLWLVYTQTVPVILEPTCNFKSHIFFYGKGRCLCARECSNTKYFLYVAFTLKLAETLVLKKQIVGKFVLTETVLIASTRLINY